MFCIGYSFITNCRLLSCHRGWRRRRRQNLSTSRYRSKSLDREDVFQTSLRGVGHWYAHDGNAAQSDHRHVFTRGGLGSRSHSRDPATEAGESGSIGISIMIPLGHFSAAITRFVEPSWPPDKVRIDKYPSILEDTKIGLRPNTLYLRPHRKKYSTRACFWRNQRHSRIDGGGRERLTLSPMISYTISTTDTFQLDRPGKRPAGIGQKVPRHPHRERREEKR